MGPLVLIAEDEPHIVESLRFILERSGFQVASVDDGARLMAAIEERTPDAIILDVMLPQSNGFEILKIMKSSDSLRIIPVLMLTAKGQQQDRRMAEQLGADAFITKPFSNREVVDCIRNLVGESQSES